MCCPIHDKPATLWLKQTAPTPTKVNKILLIITKTKFTDGFPPKNMLAFNLNCYIRYEKCKLLIDYICMIIIVYVIN